MSKRRLGAGLRVEWEASGSVLRNSMRRNRYLDQCMFNYARAFVGGCSWTDGQTDTQTDIPEAGQTVPRRRPAGRATAFFRVWAGERLWLAALCRVELERRLVDEMHKRYMTKGLAMWVSALPPSSRPCDARSAPRPCVRSDCRHRSFFRALSRQHARARTRAQDQAWMAAQCAVVPIAYCHRPNAWPLQGLTVDGGCRRVAETNRGCDGSYFARKFG
jgi:hypothetical protein